MPHDPRPKSPGFQAVGSFNLYAERELIAIAVLCLLVGFVGAIGLLA
jgi:hypothetical protein